MISFDGRTNRCRSVRGGRFLWLMHGTVLVIGLLTGCPNFGEPFPRSDFELKPLYITIQWDSAIDIMFDRPTNEANITLGEKHPACADFKVFVDGTEKTPIGLYAIASFIIINFKRDTFQKGEAYNIKVVYTADPTRQISINSLGTNERGILSSFTIQETAVCLRRNSD